MPQTAAERSILSGKNLEIASKARLSSVPTVLL